VLDRFLDLEEISRQRESSSSFDEITPRIISGLHRAGAGTRPRESPRGRRGSCKNKRISEHPERAFLSLADCKAPFVVAIKSRNSPRFWRRSKRSFRLHRSRGHAIASGCCTTGSNEQREARRRSASSTKERREMNLSALRFRACDSRCSFDRLLDSSFDDEASSSTRGWRIGAARISARRRE